MAEILGTEGDDSLLGRGSADLIRGFDGDDSLLGAGGDDEIYGGSGDDRLEGGNGDDKLYGNSGADELSGGDGTDDLVGGGGRDILRGGGGNDVMIGGSGMDTYYVSGNDTIIEENDDEGDRVMASTSYTLAAKLHYLNLTGSDKIDGTGNSNWNVIEGNDARNVLRGRGGDDALHGAGGNDWLIGGMGGDFLNGGSGADRMEGGEGFDHYMVDSADDVVIDPDGGWINTRVSLDLRDMPYIDSVDGRDARDDLVLIGNDKDNELLGGYGSDVIYGGMGDDNLLAGDRGKDLLFGGEGNDTLSGGEDTELHGGTGDDTYRPFTPLPTHIFESADGGYDTLDIILNWNSGDIPDSFGVLENIEAYVYTNAFAGRFFTAIGDERDNEFEINGAVNVQAGAGNDIILGGLDGSVLGRVTLDGETGDDVLGGGRASPATLIGGDGADRFQFGFFSSAMDFGGEHDIISDFEEGIDLISFERSSSTALPLGALSASAFHIGTAAQTAQHRVIYDNETGALYYDNDGIAGGYRQIHLATISGAPGSIDHTDFITVSGRQFGEP
jgi:serralysin